MVERDKNRLEASSFMLALKQAASNEIKEKVIFEGKSFFKKKKILLKNPLKKIRFLTLTLIQYTMVPLSMRDPFQVGA